MEYNNAEVIRDLASKAAEPQLIEVPGAPDIRIVKEDSLGTGKFNYRVLDLATHMDAPARIKEIVEFQDAKTFVDYLNDFKIPSSRLFFDNDTKTFNGVIDYSGDQNNPMWGQHRATLQLRHSEEWKAWFNLNGNYKTQRDFGKFLEDNSLDVTSPSGTDLLTLVMQFTASKSLEFHEGERLQNGNRTILWKEQTKAGETELPYKMVLTIPVYYNEAPEPVEVFLRYMIDDASKSLKLCIEFCGAERVKNNAAAKIVANVRADTDLPVHYAKRK